MRDIENDSPIIKPSTSKENRKKKENKEREKTVKEKFIEIKESIRIYHIDLS